MPLNTVTERTSTSPTRQFNTIVAKNISPIEMIKTELRDIAIEYINSKNKLQNRAIEYFKLKNDHNFNNFKYTIQQFIYLYNEDDAKLINVDPTIQCLQIDLRVWDILEINIHDDCAHDLIRELTEWCRFELYAFPDEHEYVQSIGIYPSPNNNITNTLCASTQGYTFFIDRINATNFRDHRKYSAYMFNISGDDCRSGHYLLTCFKALNKALNSELKFTTTQNEINTPILTNNTLQAINTFELFKEIVTITRDAHNLLTLGRGAVGAEGYVHLYYGATDEMDFLSEFEDTVHGLKGKNSRYYNPQIVLNQCCEFVFQRVEDEYKLKAFYGQLPEVHCGLSVSSKYASELQILQFYTKQLNDFQQAFGRAITIRQKIAVIITFISILEACHYFRNGNNRLFCQIILNKLLIEAGLSPSILRIPNGFSRFVLCNLPEELRFGDKSLASINLNELTNSLEVAINAVLEGQQFYEFITRDSHHQATREIAQETKDWDADR